jgi:hypothetical protein
MVRGYCDTIVYDRSIYISRQCLVFQFWAGDSEAAVAYNSELYLNGNVGLNYLLGFGAAFGSAITVMKKSYTRYS